MRDKKGQEKIGIQVDCPECGLSRCVDVPIKNNGLGTLKQLADGLWEVMEKEIENNGHSGLTFYLEGTARGICEIIEMNNIESFDA